MQMDFEKDILLVVPMLFCVVGCIVCGTETGLDSDESYAAGSGFDADCDFNMTMLEKLVQTSVDRKMEELHAKFFSRANSYHPRDVTPSPRLVDDIVTERKEKFKSLEFRMFRMSKDLESTKIAIMRQTSTLELMAKRNNLSPTYDITRKQKRLEKVVSHLAHRLDKLARFVMPELDPAKHTENLSQDTQPVRGPDRREGRSYPTDCDAAYRNMRKLLSGEFHVKILPDGEQEPFMALCKVFNHTGWTILQRRFNGSVDFYRPWKDYREGFGNVDGEFWIGNEIIHHITKHGQMSLRVEVQDWEGGDYYAQYDNFKIDSEEELFRLHVSGYHGTAGDSLTSAWESHDGHSFSTYDRDNDARFYDNCSEHFHGAWWFNSCFTSHLNGKFFQKGNHMNYFIRNGIQWNTLHSYASLRSSVMMVAPGKSL